MAEPVNVARFVLGNPTNGIISADGYNAEYSGKNMEEFLSLSAIEERHGATDVSKLFYEKNSKAIILRPDLELKDMGEPGEYDTTGGLWKTITIPGNPERKLLYQYDSQASWTIASDKDYKENQGFVVYWKKWISPGNSQFTIGLMGTSAFLYIIIEPRKKITIKRIVDSVTQEWQKEIPKSFLPSEGDINILTTFFINDYILIGINGTENLLALKCQKYNTATDKNSKKYPLISDENSYLSVTTSGAILLGFKKLTYEASGSLATPIGYPGYVVTGSLNADITKAIIPTGCSIKGSGHAGGNNEEDEGVSIGGSGREAIEKFGIYGIVSLIGDGQEATDEQ